MNQKWINCTESEKDLKEVFKLTLSSLPQRDSFHDGQTYTAIIKTLISKKSSFPSTSLIALFLSRLCGRSNSINSVCLHLQVKQLVKWCPLCFFFSVWWQNTQDIQVLVPKNPFKRQFYFHILIVTFQRMMLIILFSGAKLTRLNVNRGLIWRNHLGC